MIKDIVSKITYKLYGTVFKEDPSDNVKVFIKNLWYILVGFGISAIFSFIFQVLSGRILGPEEYGKYTLVQSIAMFIFIPMNLGISTALIKYNAEKEDIIRQKKIISTTYIITLLCSIFFSLFFFLFSDSLSQIFGVSLDIFNLSIIFALFLNLYTLSSSSLRSLHKMKQLSIVQAIYGFFLLFLSLTFVYALSFRIIIFITYASYFLVFLIITSLIYKYLTFDIDKYWTEKLFRYSCYAIIGSVASAFYLNFNKIIINKFLTLSDLGIFGAYFTCFIILPNFLFNIFNTVFFPMASKSLDKNKIFIKLNKMILFFVILGFPIIVALGSLLFKLYGDKYHFSFVLALMFTFTSLLVFIDSAYGWLIASVGKKGIRIASFSAIILAIVNIILSILLIPTMGLYGAVTAMMVSYFFSIGIILLNKETIKYLPV